MGPTLNCLFGEFDFRCNGIALANIWDPNNAIEIGEWSICGGGQLERCYCISNIVMAKLKGSGIDCYAWNRTMENALLAWRLVCVTEYMGGACKALS